MVRFTFYLLMVILTLIGKVKAIAAPIDSLPVITLSGTPYERGVAHGQKLKEQIKQVYIKWKQNIEKETKHDPDSIISHFLKTSNYRQAIKKYTPEIWEEVEGLAAGSGQSINDVFAFQLIDEYWGYLDRLQHNSIDKDHCTAIGIAGNGNTPTLVAQNIDIDNFMNGYQVLLHIKEEKATPEQFIMSCAGFIGFAGMNNKNVAVVINALTDLNNSITGLPVTFVTRGILQQKAPHEALYFVQKVKHATGQNYLIGTPDKVYTFEASANQVVQFNPRDNNVVYHTNHSLTNHDVKPWMEEYHKRILSGQGKQTNSQTRFSSVERQLAAQALTLNAGNIKQILSSKENSQSPICVSYREEGVAFTFSSVIFSLGNRPMAEITMGPPDTNTYKKYFLENVR
ncbi:MULTISPECIES: C45 family autoproteolytic acyltransferase/hydolase [Aequorivita]|uniref:Peptidase C45 hydrolase domain-containing protein n=1 Tax=Aequorivita iocasae TaxID=2803865 RepID=A0ABX7DQ45_9FLAO|nr:MULTISPECIES: C45 family peptidase [Aequorivita]QQX75249.1 hypothetical protein JK629_07720 [Aequorivita iocasae]UCA54697.1 C45 family peptidase [Aequorivita sp. F7]